MEEAEDMRWFRWWHDAIEDEKLLLLSFQHRWLWVVILTLASESPVRGYLYASEYRPHTVESIAVKAHLSVQVTRAGINLMMRDDFRMLERDENGVFRVVNWDKRQPKRDDVASRMRKMRNEARNALRDERVTDDADVTHYRLQSTDDTPLNPPKRGKDDYTTDFEQFWSVYPRKVNKKGAFAKWKVTLKKGEVTADQLVECAKRYAAECQRKGTSQEYILHAATFLGPQERWRDHLEDKPAPQQQEAPVYLPYTSGADVLAIIEQRRKAGGAH